MTKKIMFSLCFLLGCAQLSFAAKAYPNPWIPDGKNNNGEYVASGVYLWKVKDAGGGVSKIVIIR